MHDWDPLDLDPDVAALDELRAVYVRFTLDGHDVEPLRRIIQRAETEGAS